MIKIRDIMTKDITYYDEDFEGRLKEYCIRKDISFLPDLDQKNTFFVKGDSFKSCEINERLKIYSDQYAFDESLVEKFNTDQNILFAYDQNVLVGIIHISDYNRTEVYTYLYQLIANLERHLRKLLELKNCTDKDMLKFFEVHSDNDYYKEQYNKYSNKLQDKSIQAGPFELFDLRDLVALCKSKKIIKIDERIPELRNRVMHSRSSITPKSYNEHVLVYNFESLKSFFDDVIKLLRELRRVTNLVRIEMEKL